MSSTTDAAPESAVDVLAVVQEKPARRFPAPCWTQEETLALIEAYRERWYALRRGYLRTADWDAVAEAVFSRCPDASPAKTSAQCRHKMEKLRQRYRAEKQRSLSFPAGCFFSNWFFFENMDAMENGTQVSAARSNPDPDEQTNPGNNSFGFKTLIDQGLLKSKPNNSRKLTKPADDSNPNFGPPVPNGYLSYFDVASSKQQQVEALPLENAFPIKTRVEAIPLAIGFHPKRSGELRNGFNREYDERNDPSEEYLMRALEQRNSSHMRGSFMEGSNLDRAVSGFPRLGDKSSGGSGGGLKRERESSDSIDQIASSIRFLAEGFIKIEKMKMEMAKEIEQMRMEREMKHSEMILESQKHIVGVFGKVLSEMKKNIKKAKTFASQGES
ncbi:unnamed protein product [Cuscuta campestris]|uniref:Myb-like domain-containing protein n=1 Tax=Cuscuta campestris TaxID=132261 RepID=A0A484KNU6_9ASTE|nr:unnamed protein product [Cuscuta campestris]